MSEASPNAKGSFQKEWIKWFNQFKDDKGEWVYDRKLVEGMKYAFLPKKKHSVSSDRTGIGKAIVAEEEGEEEDDEGGADDSEDQLEKKEEGPKKQPMFPKDSFNAQVEEFADEAKHYFMSRNSTFVNRDYPYRASQPNLWFYKDFRQYLEEQQFIDKMIDVLVKMFSLHPEIPENPFEYIRDNFGTPKEEEDALVAEWIKITNEIVQLKEQEKMIEDRITARKLKQGEEEEHLPNKIDEDKRSTVSQLIMQRQKLDLFEQKKPQDVSTSDSLSEESKSPFHWSDDSSPTDIPSQSSSRLIPVDSDIVLLSPEEEVEVVTSSSSDHQALYELKSRKESSSSLDWNSSDERSQSWTM